MNTRKTTRSWFGIFIIACGLLLFFGTSEAVFNIGENLSRSTKNFTDPTYFSAPKNIGEDDEKEWFGKSPMKEVSLEHKKEIIDVWNLSLADPSNNEEFWYKYALKCAEYSQVEETVYHLKKPQGTFCERLYFYHVQSQFDSDKPILDVFGKALNFEKPFYGLGWRLKKMYFWLCIASVIVMIGAGLNTKYQRYFSILVNREGRYSLPLLQMTIWSIILFSSVALYGCLNTGIISSFPSQIWKISVFPIIPVELVLLMGISVSTPILAHFIRSVQNDGSKKFGIKPAKLDIRKGVGEPKITDFFTAQTQDNSDDFDFSAFQNLLFTFLLSGFYMMMITSVLNGFEFNHVISAWVKEIEKSLLPGLPKLGASFTALVLVSHSAYLVAMGTQGESEVQQDG